MLPNKSATHYTHSKVCSLPPLFGCLRHEPPPHPEHNTLPSPIVLSHLLSGLLADLYRLIHLTCGVLILERFVFLAADWSGFPSLLVPLPVIP